jgi:hypothetical protein
MTQALNLANFANTLNSSGQTSNSGLQNASITVTAGTGLTGGGTVALGGSVTLNNAGVTSIIAGTGISISGSSGAVTISSTTTSVVAKAQTLASGGGTSGSPMTFTYNGNSTSPAYFWGTAGSSLAQNELYTTANILQNMTAETIGSLAFATYNQTSYPDYIYANTLVAGSKLRVQDYTPNYYCCAPSYHTLPGTWRVLSIQLNSQFVLCVRSA